jgi:hypothetical protein
MSRRCMLLRIRCRPWRGRWWRRNGLGWHSARIDGYDRYDE